MFVSSHDIADMYQNAGAISSASVYQSLIDIEAQDLFGDEDGK